MGIITVRLTQSLRSVGLMNRAGMSGVISGPALGAWASAGAAKTARAAAITLMAAVLMVIRSPRKILPWQPDVFRPRLQP